MLSSSGKFRPSTCNDFTTEIKKSNTFVGFRYIKMNHEKREKRQLGKRPTDESYNGSLSHKNLSLIFFFLCAYKKPLCEMFTGVISSRCSNRRLYKENTEKLRIKGDVLCSYVPFCLYSPTSSRRKQT
jgi:hypothetical protein